MQSGGRGISDQPFFFLSRRVSRPEGINFLFKKIKFCFNSCLPYLFVLWEFQLFLSNKNVILNFFFQSLYIDSVSIVKNGRGDDLTDRIEIFFRSDKINNNNSQSCSIKIAVKLMKKMNFLKTPHTVKIHRKDCITADFFSFL